MADMQASQYVYIAMENADQEEGKGSPVPVAAFLDENEARNFIQNSIRFGELSWLPLYTPEAEVSKSNEVERTTPGLSSTVERSIYMLRDYWGKAKLEWDRNPDTSYNPAADWMSLQLEDALTRLVERLPPDSPEAEKVRKYQEWRDHVLPELTSYDQVH